MDYAGTLNTISSLLGRVPSGLVPQLDTIKSLIALATAAGATIADATRAYELISGHADGTVDIDMIEAEVEALEERGLKPVARPED